jgi:hypothetical protein
MSIDKRRLDPGVYMGANPPDLVGLPLGFLLVGVALVVMAIGVVELCRTLSNARALVAFLCLTMPWPRSWSSHQR